jgi:hypothetical protein
MPGGKGKYKVLSLKSVAGNSTKTIALLKNLLPASWKHNYAVVFLGEAHNSTVDSDVTTAMLANPPLFRAAAAENRVLYERGLQNKYPITSASFGTTRTENSALNVGNTARSAVIADMALDAFQNHGVRVIYLPCGSKHATEVFAYMDKRSEDAFDFLSKMDDESYGK